MDWELEFERWFDLEPVAGVGRSGMGGGMAGSGRLSNGRKQTKLKHEHWLRRMIHIGQTQEEDRGRWQDSGRESVSHRENS